MRMIQSISSSSSSPSRLSFSVSFSLSIVVKLLFSLVGVLSFDGAALLESL